MRKSPSKKSGYTVKTGFTIATGAGAGNFKFNEKKKKEKREIELNDEQYSKIVLDITRRIRDNSKTD